MTDPIEKYVTDTIKDLTGYLETLMGMVQSERDEREKALERLNALHAKEVNEVMGDYSLLSKDFAALSEEKDSLEKEIEEVMRDYKALSDRYVALSDEYTILLKGQHNE